jgi:serralysin
LKTGGNYIGAGTLGAWTPIAAEAIIGGYEVAWKNTVADQYLVWKFDASGNYSTTLLGVVAGSDPNLKSFETSFHQDLNGNGVIGGAPIASSSTTDSGTPAGSGAGAAGTVTLIANYIASTFVPTGGASPNFQSPADSPDQQFLAKPAA